MHECNSYNFIAWKMSLPVFQHRNYRTDLVKLHFTSSFAIYTYVCNTQLWMSYVAACSIYSLVTDVRQTHLPCLYVPFTDHEEMVLTDIRKKKESIPLPGMASVSTQTRLFLANEVERLRVLGNVFSSCQSLELPAPCHTPMHRHTAGQMRGGGPRKHEGLRSTKRPRMLGVNQKMLLTESLYHFHSKVSMNFFFFFLNPASGNVPVWIYHSHMNKLNPKGSVTRTNKTEGTLRKKHLSTHPSPVYFHKPSATSPCTMQKRLFIQPITVDLL